MWWAGITLCLFAALVHLPTREARVAPAVAPADGLIHELVIQDTSAP